MLNKSSLFFLLTIEFPGVGGVPSEIASSPRTVLVPVAFRLEKKILHRQVYRDLELNWHRFQNAS